MVEFIFLIEIFLCAILQDLCPIMLKVPRVGTLDLSVEPLTLSCIVFCWKTVTSLIEVDYNFQSLYVLLEMAIIEAYMFVIHLDWLIYWTHVRVYIGNPQCNLVGFTENEVSLCSWAKRIWAWYPESQECFYSSLCDLWHVTEYPTAKNRENLSLTWLSITVKFDSSVPT